MTMVTVVEMTTNLRIPYAKKKKYQSTNKTTKTTKLPHRKSETETKEKHIQNTGNPNKGETVKISLPAYSSAEPSDTLLLLQQCV